MEKLISVAIVNWNGEKYLYKCIKSLLDQKYKNIEVIIIDNDSTDNSVKIIEDNFKNDEWSSDIINFDDNIPINDDYDKEFISKQRYSFTENKGYKFK